MDFHKNSIRFEINHEIWNKRHEYALSNRHQFLCAIDNQQQQNRESVKWQNHVKTIRYVYMDLVALFLITFLCMWIFFLFVCLFLFVWHKSDVKYKKMLNHSFDISIYAQYILVVGGERISILLNYLFAMKCAVSCICVIEIICMMKSMSRTCCMSYYLLAWIKEYESISVLVFHHHCQSRFIYYEFREIKITLKKGEFAQCASMLNIAYSLNWKIFSNAR